VDDITYTTAVNSGQSVTSSAILGPFYRHDHPIRPNGTTISFDTPADAEPVFMFGRVLSADGKPLANASVEAWQASTNGMSTSTKKKRAFPQLTYNDVQAFMSSRILTSKTSTSVESSLPMRKENILSIAFDLLLTL